MRVDAKLEEKKQLLRDLLHKQRKTATDSAMVRFLLDELAPQLELYKEQPKADD